ncbi:hypothetical protein OH492_26140 [Vibrio chagasii]|nr:hypothetical protein [Vibrio chagasii]
MEVPHEFESDPVASRDGDIVQATLAGIQDLYPEIELDIHSISNGFIDMYRQRG